MTAGVANLDAAAEQVARQKRWVARVTGQVLKNLGTPPALHDVQVRQVNSRSYRVNVRIRRHDSAISGLCQVEVLHSFFCVIDEAGMVMGSNPAIKKCYE